jgi:hypothetical protein
MRNVIFCDVAPCVFIINRRFGGTCRLHLQGRRNNASEEKCLKLTDCSSEALNENLGRKSWAVGRSNQRSVLEERWGEGSQDLKDCSQWADTVASQQVPPIVSGSCYEDFLREQMRGFHDLLRQKPTSLFILLG